MDYPPELIEDQKYELSHYDKLVKIGEGTFGYVTLSNSLARYIRVSTRTQKPESTARSPSKSSLCFMKKMG